ncbi:hypothetical protein XELAEV_18007953mg [Xenopus laevis]|uniref:Uncharacterized protein n=1 Tax=Xenopus laevis TaxID=8355 RepID=A0A974E3C9_XENLA|nr:hypothetical protein XELAEV_18007953mg [Xenopus laevis]
MACVATVTDIKGQSGAEGVLTHADLAGVYKGPHEDTLFLENKERLCHGEERNIITQEVKFPSQKQITTFTLHSPLSKYQGYLIKQKSRQHCIAQNVPSHCSTTELS